jgi:hypothetical protein
MARLRSQWAQRDERLVAPPRRIRQELNRGLISLCRREIDYGRSVGAWISLLPNVLNQQGPELLTNKGPLGVPYSPERRDDENFNTIASAFRRILTEDAGDPISQGVYAP